MMDLFRRMTSNPLRFAIALLVGSSIEATADAQVVQQPVVSNFSMSGGLSVPDSGEGYAAAINRGSWGARSSGMPYRSSGSSSRLNPSSLTVTAQVIDLDALDAAILAEAAKRRDSNPSRFRAPATGPTIVNTLRATRSADASKTLHHAPVMRDPYGVPFSSPIAEAPDYLGGPGAIHDDAEIRYFLERAHSALVQGRTESARVYFRLALERMTPDQRERMAAKVRERAELAAAAAKGTKVEDTSGQSSSRATGELNSGGLTPTTTPADPFAMDNGPGNPM